MNQKLVLCYVLAAAALNVVLSTVLKPHATQAQLYPGNASELPFTSQVMHLLVQNSGIPISSGLVLGGLVVLSVYLGDMCFKHL